MNYQIFIIVGSFIIFDIITGFIKALYKNKINSTIIRQGLYHKLTELLAMIFSAGVEYSANYINIGVQLPVLIVVSAYIIIMEIISIIENLCEVNPTLAKLFKPYLDKLKKWGDTMTLICEVPYQTVTMTRLQDSSTDFIIVIENYRYKVDKKNYIICESPNTPGTNRSIIITAEKL